MTRDKVKPLVIDYEEARVRFGAALDQKALSDAETVQLKFSITITGNLVVGAVQLAGKDKANAFLFMSACMGEANSFGVKAADLSATIAKKLADIQEGK